MLAKLGGAALNWAKNHIEDILKEIEKGLAINAIIDWIKKHI
ncbi:aureocin A53 family class IId bacteriocin [Leuconostoc pseudomesenteroides]|nr:aureocin A53 family class IId bacteriocin [Leuconostoc pseudomesenteroides]